jgi:hypothetical protein
MSSFRRLLYLFLLASTLLFKGCAWMYFHDAGRPPSTPPQFELSDWPYQENWTGIVFNGAKIGFSHFTLLSTPSASDRFDIRSKAVMRLRFLNFDKKINLESYDQVARDLALMNFDYEYDLDGNVLKLQGRRADNTLEVSIETEGQKRRQTVPVEGKVYSTSIINLYPLLHGLEVGRSYTYMVYDGETQTVSPVEQKIVAYEESDLYTGPAFKIKTRLHGHEVTTWMDASGRPLLEMSLGGVIISALENKSTATEYLAQAALNKAETLLDFSLIKSDTPIDAPRQVTFVEVALTGIGDNLDMPFDDRQQCRRKGDEIHCRIYSEPSNPLVSDQLMTLGPAAPYLQPSYIIPSYDRRIRQTAREITQTVDATNQQINLLLDWIQENVQQEPVDVFSALDVLNERKAECQGHTYLYAAFARALNIPTRVVNGIVYSENFQGFLYHTWAESLVEGRWIAIDPTFRQMPADATHIKLIEGEKMSDLVPLVDIIGKVKLQIIQTH